MSQIFLQRNPPPVLLQRGTRKPPLLRGIAALILLCGRCVFIYSKKITGILKFVASIADTQFAKSIFLFILLSICTSSISAQQQNPQQVFDQANRQLQQGNVPQALTIYQQLENQNQVSGALFLNMGLSYMQMGSMGKAKYYFLKARQFDETEERAEEGLDYMETRFSHQSAVLPELPWQRVLNWLSDEIGSATLLGIGLILFNLGIALFIAAWFMSRSSKWWDRSAIGVAAAGCLIILLSFYTNYCQQRYSKAVMITRETNVMEQPNPDATIVNQAFEGYTFTVDHSKSQEQANWSYIRMSNGLYGWIPTEEIMIL